ncbi:ferredoxin, partial [Tannerella forsythia]
DTVYETEGKDILTCSVIPLTDIEIELI